MDQLIEKGIVFFSTARWAGAKRLHQWVSSLDIPPPWLHPPTPCVRTIPRSLPHRAWNGRDAPTNGEFSFRPLTRPSPPKTRTKKCDLWSHFERLLILFNKSKNLVNFSHSFNNKYRGREGSPWPVQFFPMLSYRVSTVQYNGCNPKIIPNQS